MRPLCALYAPSMRPLCALYAPSMRPLCALYAPCMRPLCALYAPSMRPLCALYAPSMRPVCALYAPSMRPLCALYAPSMRPLCAWCGGWGDCAGLHTTRGTKADSTLAWPPGLNAAIPQTRKRVCNAPSPAACGKSSKGTETDTQGAFSHSAGTAPIITVFIPGTPLQTTPPTEAGMIHSKPHWRCRVQDPGIRGYRRWKTADLPHGAPPNSTSCWWCCCTARARSSSFFCVFRGFYPVSIHLILLVHPLHKC